MPAPRQISEKKYQSVLLSNYDDFVKSRFCAVFVIPAEAGIQLNQAVLDSRLRGSDGLYDFLRIHQLWIEPYTLCQTISTADGKIHVFARDFWRLDL